MRELRPHPAGRGRCASTRRGFSGGQRGGQRPGRAPAAGGPVADHRPAGRAAEGPRDPDLPEGRVRSPAAGSSDDAPDAGLAEATACPPHTARQRNCPRPPAPARPFRIQPFRPGLETGCSGLTDRFPQSRHAPAAGVALKSDRFGFVHAIDRFGL